MTNNNGYGEDSAEPIYFYHDWGRDNSVTTTIVNGVAAVTNTPKMDLDPPLQEVVNPDALDSLFQPLDDEVVRDKSGQLSFELHGCTVTLFGEGTIKIDPPDEL